MTTLTIIKGDTAVLPVTFTDNTGTAINLTGSTVFFTAKKNETDTDANAKIKKDITSHTTPAQGKTQITLTSTDTNLEPGMYFWDLQIKDSLGSISSTIAGKLQIIQDITTRTA